MSISLLECDGSQHDISHLWYAFCAECDGVYILSSSIELPLWVSPLRSHADDSSGMIGSYSRLQSHYSLDDRSHSPCARRGRYLVCRLLLEKKKSTVDTDFVTRWRTMTNVCSTDDLDTSIDVPIPATICSDRCTDDIPTDSSYPREISSHRSVPKPRTLSIRTSRRSVSPSERPSEWNSCDDKKCHGKASR